MKRVRYLAALFLSLASAATLAAVEKPAAESLRHFFGNVRSYSARFNQVVLDEAFNVIQESSGTLSIARPDRFRWDYDAPFKQHIIADGQKIWVYDEELKQVTVRPLAGGLADTPAVLLAGKGRIDDTYVIKNLGMQGELNWVQLTPRRKDGGFEDIRIGFDQGRLRTLEMVDGFGQMTRVTLLSAKENPKLDPARFQFTPPKGVDVVGE
jgi:outer membrane lipoprotein carrier protein